MGGGRGDEGQEGGDVDVAANIAAVVAVVVAVVGT